MRCPVHHVALVDDPFIGRALGPYTITGYLGSGAMGVVYRAHPPAAVKILNVVRARLQPELVRRFELEASAIARLQNPHTVRLYDAGTTGDGHLYITMELLSGQTLDEVLRVRQRLEPADAADVIHQAASALGEAHEKWVVHRDVKPDNLFLEAAENGRPFVRVLDFGVVRINTESVARSLSGTVAGTPSYMSPEQLKSEKVIDGRTDIYSLGVVLHQALSGRNPFQGDGLMQTIQRHLYLPVPPLPSSVPAPLADLTMAMLMKAREDRPASMLAVQQALAAMGLVRAAPVRLAAVDSTAPVVIFEHMPLAERRSDPAFQRARQVTPVARPMDPVPDEGDALDAWLMEGTEATVVSGGSGGSSSADASDGSGSGGSSSADGSPISDGSLAVAFARHHAVVDAAADAAAFGDTIDDIAPVPTPPVATPPVATAPGPTPPAAARRATADPWRTSAPPQSRPPIDAPPPDFGPREREAGDFAAAEALPAARPAALATWSAGRAFESSEVAPPDAMPSRRRTRWVVVFIALIFALGAASGIWLSARHAAGDGMAGVSAHSLRIDARAAMEREAWDEAIDALDRVLAARPGDEAAMALHAQATRELQARETWHEILDRIADEQWQAALHRVEAFPAESVYAPRAQALRGLIDEGIAEAQLEEAFAQATRGEWSGAIAIADALAARPAPPEGLALLRAAIERRRFAPTAYTLHLLEARERMNNGDWRLAITRLSQAAEDIDQPDLRIERRLFVCSRALGEAASALRHALAWRRLERDPRYGPVLGHAIERLQARVKVTGL